MDLPKRKDVRLKNYDYSKNGYYFITICTQNKEKILWEKEMKLSYIGMIVKKAIKDIPNHYKNIKVDKFCIMPNHIHIILIIDNNECRGDHWSSEVTINESGRAMHAPTIGKVINQTKGYITKQIGKSIWQKLYYDEVIRNDKHYNKVLKYIKENPLKWTLDEYY